MIIKGYKYRIYPTKEQEVLMQKHFGCVRWIYNWGLERKKKEYEATGKSPSAYSLCNELTILKKQEATIWLSEVNRNSLEAALNNLDKAYKKFFRDKEGFPNFKSKHKSRKTFTLRGNIKVDFEKGILKTEHFGSGLICKFHRVFEGDVKRATICQSASGKYYASLLVETPGEEIPCAVPDINRSIGIDLGIKTFAVLSTGEEIANPKHLRTSLRKLKRLQRSVSRKVKGSNNRDKAKKILAIQHEKVANRRTDFLHQTTARLIRENQAGTLCLEDLNVKGMVKNHNLAQALSDISIGTFNQFLNYKAKWNGVNILRCGRFEPSSKTCNNCGWINAELKLHHRKWQCSCCGHTHDRDLNAALNIRDFCFGVRRESPEFTLLENGVTCSVKEEISPEIVLNRRERRSNSLHNLRRDE